MKFKPDRLSELSNLGALETNSRFLQAQGLAQHLQALGFHEFGRGGPRVAGDCPLRRPALVFSAAGFSMRGSRRDNGPLRRFSHLG